MRVCWDMADLEEGYTLAKNEAISTVGDGTMMMQHFVCPNKGRHIEIQVLCDKHGNYVYLNERECSVQRRHQKVIEEAPSPLVTPEMRKEMGEQAVALCKAVGYVSAGTVEFLVDPDLMKWYFLEMNTRLQVEHPITEHITGVDIVEEMIRVAADKPLSITQDDVGIDGWAFEARVYAEDPVSAEMFRPDSGPLEYLKTPETGTDGDFTVRVDTGVEEGDNVTVFYDPMICKLIVHGPDRAAALSKLRSSLREYNIAGLRTNIDFVHSVAATQSLCLAITPPPLLKRMRKSCLKSKQHLLPKLPKRRCRSSCMSSSQLLLPSKPLLTPPARGPLALASG